VEFGVAVGNFGAFGKQGGVAEIIEVARFAELTGYDSVWVHDHLVMPATIRARYPYNDSGVSGFAYRQDIYDPLAIMAALAVKTQRVRIGTSVLIIPYRNPVLLARMLATLDQLSGGRIILGLGVGWMAEEFDALGIGDYYPIRGSVTDEWIRICTTLWSSPGPADYDGRFHSFKGLDPRPRPVQQPSIPLWVGGKGSVAARRVARYGSGYHTITSTPEAIRAELRLVRAELEARGRQPSEIIVSMLGPAVVIGGTKGAPPGAVAGSKAEMIDQLAAYADAGLEHAIILPSFAGGPPQQSPKRMMEAMQFVAEELMPALRSGPDGVTPATGSAMRAGNTPLST
jgi:probable F420-dependent oxidoreductase